MIIQLDGAAEDVEKATRSLSALVGGWGDQVAQTPTLSVAPGAARAGEKAIDPVSVTALVLSIPSTVLAVMDLADRIRKRRRATELIDHAQRLANQRVTVSVIFESQPVELATLDPDQLLDLVADEKAAG